MGSCFFCRDGSCEECQAKISVAQILKEENVVNLKEGELAKIMRECTEKSVALSKIEMELANFKREVENREYGDFHCRISDLERENENLRMNQAPKLADELAKREAEIKIWESDCATLQEDLKKVNGALTDGHIVLQKLLREVGSLKIEIIALKEKIAVLKGERPSLFARAVAPMKNLGVKLGQPFVAVAEMMSNFLVGAKVSTLSILWLIWLAVRVCCWRAPKIVLMSIFALPTAWFKFEASMPYHRGIDLCNCNILEWAKFTSFVVVNLGGGFMLLVCSVQILTGVLFLTGVLSPSVWLPNILTYLGVHSAPYVCPHLSLSQNLSLLHWLGVHFMSIVHGIYWTLLTTNLGSLVAEIGRARRANKNKKVV